MKQQTNMIEQIVLKKIRNNAQRYKTVQILRRLEHFNSPPKPSRSHSEKKQEPLLIDDSVVHPSPHALGTRNGDFKDWNSELIIN